MTDTAAHEEKDTLHEDVNVPEHDKRVTTALFERTKKDLIEKMGGKCWVCGRTQEEAGHPLEAHHRWVERCLTEMIDWDLVKPDFPDFDWEGFFLDAEIVNIPATTETPAYTYRKPKDPYLFVDDMRVNGMLLCKEHHTGEDSGIHRLSYPMWLGQKYGLPGYKFSDKEILEHEG